MFFALNWVSPNPKKPLEYQSPSLPGNQNFPPNAPKNNKKLRALLEKKINAQWKFPKGLFLILEWKNFKP